MENLSLFLVHCGYYDPEVQDGVYESHANFAVAAESFEDARARVKLEPEFMRKRMHVDGLQHVAAVSGCRVELKFDALLEGRTEIRSNRHRDLAPKPVVSV